MLYINNPDGIRRFRPDDAPFLLEAVRESVEELCAFMTWCHPGYSLEDSRSFIAKCNSDWELRQQYNFAIIDPEDKTLLGSIGLNRIDQAHKCANIGYWVRRSHTRRGVATAATRLITRFGLEELGLHRLELLIPRANAASQRVALKAGAALEGALRGRLVLADGVHNALLYSLVPGDLTLTAAQRQTISSPV